MKIYNEIIFDADGKVIYEDSNEYSGDVIMVKGGKKEDEPTVESKLTGISTDYLSPNIDLSSGITFTSGGIFGQMGESLEEQREAREAEEARVLAETLAEEKLQLQTEAWAKEKALPSITSVSNVGSSPFTGVVNWNAIPGGFQPLPQTVGRSKKLYQFSQFHGGINQKSSARDIADFECQEAINVTVSNIGKIKLLGDCLNENNTLKEFAAISNVAYAPLPGYGLFEFTAPADWDGANEGEYQILLTSDSDQIDALDHDDDHVSWIDFNGSGASDTDVAPVFYAGGNGVYVSDATFSNANDRKARIYVSRKDYNQTITTKGWSSITSAPLITSPTFIFSSADTIDGAAARKVTLDWQDGNAPDLASGTDGAACVHIGSANTGNWNGDYFIYISFLFDGGCETGLTALQKTDVGAPNGPYTFANEKLYFNFSITNTDSGGTSSTNYIGHDIRIEGARIYFKKSGDVERFLLAEVSLIDGIKGGLDSTFTPWDHNSGAYNLASNMIFDSPPEIHTYLSLNGYYANEIYNKSGDTIADNTAGPAPLSVKYKTAITGQQGIIFIGNVEFDGKHKPDTMMWSMLGKPGVFPKFNYFDSPSSDGSPITALAAFQDTILQFKKNAMYVINVSNPGQPHAQASFRDCGVFNPCQVFTTAFGVIFANKNGCFIYDGQKVISLTNGKFDWTTQSYIGGASPAIEETSNSSTSNFPCVGYDPRSQSIIVLKDIGDDSDSTSDVGEGAWIYNLATQSWTEGADMITNADGTRHSNFIITNDGYLSIKSNGDPTLLNYNHDMQTGTNSTASAQSIEYITKDLDFGLPSQTKKIFKVYVTYKGDCDSIGVYFRTDGNATDRQFNSANTPLSDVGSTLTTVALTPTTASQAKDIKSFALRFTGEVGVDSADVFEINDISILYRVRPIK